MKIEYRNKKFNIENKSEFQKLNSKGFGIDENKKYFLNIYETLFLVEKNKIKVFEKNKEIDFNKILKNSKIDFKEYLIYKDLKIKGYNILSGSKFGFTFRIYDKGIKVGEDHSLWLVEPINDNEKIKFKEILGKNRIAHSTNKKLIYAIIDIDNSITYIENSWKRM